MQGPKVPCGPSKGCHVENGTLIVGASLGGLRVAEGLRKQGYQDRILLLGDETHLPYDRPPLSKTVLTGSTPVDALTFRTDEWFGEMRIEPHLGVAAQALDVERHQVTTSAGVFDYDTLVIATGATARTLAGAEELAGVHTMRTREDAISIQAAFADRPRVAVVGAGFIGAEVASSAHAHGLDVTVIEALAHPLARAVGEQAGLLCAALHDAAGVTLRCGVGVQGLLGDRAVTGVQLVDGSVVPAELVVIGIGVSPNTEWLVTSGLDISNGVQCNEYLQAAPGVYALGDVASWWNPLFDEQMRVEHWTNTVEQAVTVARNIIHANEPKPYAGVPYFWSDQYDRRIQFAGRSVADEILTVPGSVDAATPLVLFRRGDRLIGALAIDNARILMTLRGMIMRGSTWYEALLLAEETFPVATQSAT